MVKGKTIPPFNVLDSMTAFPGRCCSTVVYNPAFMYFIGKGRLHRVWPACRAQAYGRTPREASARDSSGEPSCLYCFTKCSFSLKKTPIVDGKHPLMFARRSTLQSDAIKRTQPSHTTCHASGRARAMQATASLNALVFVCFVVYIRTLEVRLLPTFELQL